MIRFEAGDLRLTILDAGELWLDGGAMFGVVPRTLWERLRPPDARNRIRLGMNVLLVEDGTHRVLVDTGAGTKWDDKRAAIYGLSVKGADEILAPAGLSPESIDLVVNSHLHFDHAGGNTHLDPAGTPVASYPNATYVVQRGELEFARSGNERVRASYFPENFEPLAADGRLRTVEGPTTILPWLDVVPAPGHTPHLHLPRIRAGGRTVAYLADLVPTASHVPYPYIMGYDVEPLRTLESKKRILPEALREGWWLVFEHDRDLPLGELVESDGKIAARACGTEA